MSKAILVIDMPESCDDCQLKVLDCDLYYTTYACQNVDCETSDILKTIKYEMNCPLKPLPKLVRLDEEEHFISSYWQKMGWNNCLKNILGEKNDE